MRGSRGGGCTSDRDGYTAVQLGTEVSKSLNKPESGQLKEMPTVATIREFSVDDVDAYTVGCGSWSVNPFCANPFRCLKSHG